MKTSAIIVAAAALVSAQAPPEGTNTVNCAKPNANYCLGGDIILRCDANGTGLPGRCSANLAGFPPQGGFAECWESSKTAGDATCQKNCVVYSASSSFTLPASTCTPSFTAPATGAPTAVPTTLETSAPYYPVPSAPGSSSWVSSAPVSSAPVYSTPPAYTTTVVNGTVVLTVPCDTTTTPVYLPPTQSVPVVVPPAGTGVAPAPPVGGNQTVPSGTNVPVPPTAPGSAPGSGSTPTTVPNAGAVNRAAGVLAFAGLVAVCFL